MVCESKEKKEDKEIIRSEKKINKVSCFGFMSACLFSVIILLTSVDILCFRCKNFLKNEYEKYQVNRELPFMDMSEKDGIMAVSNHMMAYLKGEKGAENLQLKVMINGEKKEFFSERELIHMEDCKKLFDLGRKLRRVLFTICTVITLGTAAAFRPVAGWVRAFGRGYINGTLVFSGLAVLTAAAAAADFSGSFVKFHRLFFNNDYWMLDPRKDLMINMLPEGLFFDAAIHISIIFVLLQIIMLLIWITAVKKTQSI